jgi:hypothetical protein
MLTASQKSNILVKAGRKVPPFPARSLPVQERFLHKGVRIPQAEIDADVGQALAVVNWTSDIEALYAAYVAERAAKSLREAEESDLLVRMRNAM